GHNQLRLNIVPEPKADQRFPGSDSIGSVHRVGNGNEAHLAGRQIPWGVALLRPEHQPAIGIDPNAVRYYKTSGVQLIYIIDVGGEENLVRCPVFDLEPEGAACIERKCKITG